VRPGLRLVLAAACAAALGLGARAWYEQRRPDLPAPLPVPDGVRAAMPGQHPDPIRLPDLDGNLVELAAIAPGRPLLVNVWASWCGPCVEEMPELQRFAAAQGADGVQVVGLALDEAEAVRAFLRQVPVDYPILLDRPGPADASVRLGNTRGLLPYTVLLDRQRRVLRQKLGPFQPGEIADWAAAGTGPD
jgi:Thiol-disulfide isomerase and thioredoxins